MSKECAFFLFCNDPSRHTIGPGWYHRPLSIPESYKNASIEDRIAVVQGLMDTDGTVDRYGLMSYCTVSSSLKDCVVEIVNSLGGRALVKERIIYIFIYKNYILLYFLILKYY
jgi:hypothetical protein